MGDHVIGHGDDQAVQKGWVSCAHPFAHSVEEKGASQRDGHFVARPEPRIGISQRDEVALAEIDMQMILIAEMLDPSDAAEGAPAVGFADVGVLGANADCRCASGIAMSANRERGAKLIGGLPNRAAT